MKAWLTARRSADPASALGQAHSRCRSPLCKVSGKLALAERDTLFAAMQEALVPPRRTSPTSLAAMRRRRPRRSRRVLRTRSRARYEDRVYLFAGDGTFVHQTIDPGVPSTTSTVFDNGFGYRTVATQLDAAR